MKLSAVFIGAFLAAPLVDATVGIQWYFPSATDFLDEVTFPMSIANAPRQEGYYFAQQFFFDGIRQGGYMGLQPRYDDWNGDKVLHAAFSSFQGGTTTTHRNCHDTADGGPGVSCAIDIDGAYVNTYNLTIKGLGRRTWQGLLIDTVTGRSHEIGVWTLPAGAGNLQTSGPGFVEYYPWNSPKDPDCTKAPRTEVTFFDPQSPNTSPAKIDPPYDYGDCLGQEDFRAVKVADGYTIHYGTAASSGTTQASSIHAAAKPSTSSSVNKQTVQEPFVFPDDETTDSKLSPQELTDLLFFGKPDSKE
ncbi:Rhamnolipids biosynthesis 3-oxoacyl-reductase [Purpureocillium lavendulum]|uniref:Rhamnolipids biosynthesis 3-oxoacyl-reductase n=1 Tax=Purpureocillium lavendulum TaxID=1247861 RepID=A0AB34FL80_9HYPO|nr:Rhamnolipids biosynthesis 3-oxoacyl-reductase [Purpureocillium lavendulum]